MFFSQKSFRFFLNKKFVYPIKYRNMRKKLKNKNFSVISDNCWGGELYQELGIKYNTPFVNLFIYTPDYLKILKNFKSYMNYELKEIRISKYKGECNYPLGILNDVEIHFLHYPSFEVAKEKCNKRLKRINYDNLFFKINDRDLSTDKLIIEFDNLPFKNKVSFTTKKYNLESNVYLKYADNSSNDSKFIDMFCYKYDFDAISWLNGGGSGGKYSID